jgi:hypothetical protein
MTSPDTPSSHVAVIERSEVVGELAWIDNTASSGLHERQRSDDPQGLQSS